MMINFKKNLKQIAVGFAAFSVSVIWGNTIVAHQPPDGMPGTAPSSCPTNGMASPSPGCVVVKIAAGSTGKGTEAFGVNPLVIHAGTIVTWVNEDSLPHTATSETGVWDSGTLATGQMFPFKFDNPGSYPYICQIHGKASMSGMIQVEP